jgi:hypothetical protein
MMLDADGDVLNGITISDAVRAAAAGWAQVDFATSDLPAALANIVLSAKAADGAIHAVPSPAAAQTIYTASFMCAFSGAFAGTRASATSANNRITAEVYPDGSVEFVGYDPAVSGAIALEASGPATSVAVAPTPGFNITGSTSTHATLNVSAHYASPDTIEGELSSGLTGSFSLQRIASDPTTRFRFAGDVGDLGSGHAIGVIDLDVSATNVITGTLYRLDADQSLPITGIANGTAFSGTIGGSAFTAVAALVGNVPKLTGDVLGSLNVSFKATGCRLN